MDNLAQCLRYYVADRLSNDPGWKNVAVSKVLLLKRLSVDVGYQPCSENDSYHHSSVLSLTFCFNPGLPV